MSSAGIVIPPGATVAASAALAELTASAAGVLTVWAADVLAACAVEGLGEKGRQGVAGPSSVQDSELVWEQVAVDVVELNARIRMASERPPITRAAKVLPQPLSLTGRTVAEAAHWCRETERLLAATSTDADEQASASVLAAQRLAVLGDSAVANGRLPPPFTNVVATLRDVVAGRAELTLSLRSLSGEAVAWAGEKVHRHFIAETMHACMAELGYHQESDFDVEFSADVRLTHPEWNGEHSAEIWMDREGVLYGRLSRETAMPGEAAPRERNRCARFNFDVGVLGRRLRAEAVADDTYVPADPEHHEPVRVTSAARVGRPTPSAPSRQEDGS